MKRIPYMLIVGEKEAENREVSVRKQGEGDQGTMIFEDFAKKVTEEVQNTEIKGVADISFATGTAGNAVVAKDGANVNFENDVF